MIDCFFIATSDGKVVVTNDYEDVKVQIRKFSHNPEVFDKGLSLKIEGRKITQEEFDRIYGLSGAK